MSTDPGECVMKIQHGTTGQPTLDLSSQYNVRGIPVIVLSLLGQHVPETQENSKKHKTNTASIIFRTGAAIWSKGNVEPNGDHHP
jgi:hypothetical protein